jgi:2-methylisocitrate lyase-like PEP mutase family enzyme
MTAPDQTLRKGIAFRDLHAAGTFVMPNPWDAGTARLLTALGTAALATTSAGLAFTLGHPDGQDRVSRDDTLANAAAIVSATHLPVSADLESCYAATPDEVGEKIRRAASVGLVGGSIEDATADPAAPILAVDVAVARVAAAVAAARALPFPFTLTARAENYLYGKADLDDTIRRLVAYQEAGADVLYAPGLPDLDAIRAVCDAVDRPVNVLGGPAHSVRELARCGVRRVSLGSALSRTALAAVRSAAQEVREQGTFTFATLPYAEANALMETDGSR